MQEAQYRGPLKWHWRRCFTKEQKWKSVVQFRIQMLFVTLHTSLFLAFFYSSYKSVITDITRVLQYKWPPLSSSGQSSCLQIQRPGFDSRCYQIFWEVVGLERGPHSLMSTIEELLGRKSSGSSLENRDYVCTYLPRWQRGTLYPQQLTPTSSTSGGLSVGIVCSRTRTMEFSLVTIQI
jgi:hypothetical protein